MLGGKKMKFIKKLVGDAKTNWDNLNTEQKLTSFNLMWDGKQIPNNRWINKIKGKLPGIHYQTIYLLIEKVCEIKQREDIERLKKELLDFYSRPITELQKTYYPLYKEQVETNLDPVNDVWLKEKILPDLKECEELQKNRMLKRYGLPFDQNILLKTSSGTDSVCLVQNAETQQPTPKDYADPAGNANATTYSQNEQECKPENGNNKTQNT